MNSISSNTDQHDSIRSNTSLDVIGQSQTVTMTSREIAGLTGKEHKNVIRDIRSMLDELNADGSNLIHPEEEKDSRGYTACFHLNRELTDTLLTGYSATARIRVVRRWHELESRQAVDPLQVLNDPAAMRGLLLGYTEKVIALESKVAEQAPKVAALERISIADGEFCLQTTGKLLGEPPNKFCKWLHSLGTWIFKRAGSTRYSAKVEQIRAGYLAVRSTTVTRPDGSEKVHEQVVVTPKGLVKLAQMLGVRLNGDLFA